MCSLRPGEARLTKSVFITYDEDARVLETGFANTVIRSAARLEYAQASAALEGKRGLAAPELMPLLRDAETLARRIRTRRQTDGMIVLALPEVRVELGEDGRIVGAGAAESSFSHTIIEMFMVEANEAVSRRLTEAGLAHLRRVHPTPDPDAEESLAQADSDSWPSAARDAFA